MSWTLIEESPARETDIFLANVGHRDWDNDGKWQYQLAPSTSTIGLAVWKCDGCGAKACGRIGEDPGKCLKPGCRYAGESKR